MSKKPAIVATIKSTFDINSLITAEEIDLSLGMIQ
jgi:hypothetical protein